MAAPGTDANPGLNTQPPRPRVKTERWRRLECLFYACSEMDPHAWPAFLAAACGDDVALRQEVESLMASADQPVDFLRQPVRSAAQEIASEAVTRRRLGNYELIQLIGEGGMGQVWLATRADEQFERQVAIKLM